MCLNCAQLFITGITLWISLILGLFFQLNQVLVGSKTRKYSSGKLMSGQYTD